MITESPTMEKEKTLSESITHSVSSFATLSSIADSSTSSESFTTSSTSSSSSSSYSLATTDTDTDLEEHCHFINGNHDFMRDYSMYHAPYYSARSVNAYPRKVFEDDNTLVFFPPPHGNPHIYINMPFLDVEKRRVLSVPNWRKFKACLRKLGRRIRVAAHDIHFTPWGILAFTVFTFYLYILMRALIGGKDPVSSCGSASIAVALQDSDALDSRSPNTATQDDTKGLNVHIFRDHATLGHEAQVGETLGREHVLPPTPFVAQR